MDWASLWESIKTFFSSSINNILIFIAVTIIGVIIIKLLLNVTKKILYKTKLEKITLQFFVGIVKFLLYLFLIMILLDIIGVKLTGLVTALSAVVLTIGVALQDNIANFANGIIIISTRMFKKGDYIITEDAEGCITNINFLFTTLITTDNRRVTFPNSKIVNGVVTNNGAYPYRRISLTFSVAYESDIELVKKVVTEVMKSNGKVYLDKPIFCRLKTLNSSSLDFFSYCWVDNEDYWDVYYYIMENVYNEFKRNGISVPFSQVEVRNRTDDVVYPVIGTTYPKRVEKVRHKKKEFDLEDADLTKVFNIEKITSNIKKSRKKTKSSNVNKDIKTIKEEDNTEKTTEEKKIVIEQAVEELKEKDIAEVVDNTEKNGAKNEQDVKTLAKVEEKENTELKAKKDNKNKK